jgi:hypothetical protein
MAELEKTIKEEKVEDVKNGKEKVAKAESEKVGTPSPHTANWILAGIVVFIVLVVLLTGAVFTFRLAHRILPDVRNETTVSRVYGFPGHRNFDGRGRINGVNNISGKVTTVSGQTFTIDVNGQSKTVLILDTTRFPINSATSVKTGDQVVVFGQQDSKGVIQATRILVNPQD